MSLTVSVPSYASSIDQSGISSSQPSRTDSNYHNGQMTLLARLQRGDYISIEYLERTGQWYEADWKQASYGANGVYQKYIDNGQLYHEIQNTNVNMLMYAYGMSNTDVNAGRTDTTTFSFTTPVDEKAAAPVMALPDWLTKIIPITPQQKVQQTQYYADQTVLAPNAAGVDTTSTTSKIQSLITGQTVDSYSLPTNEIAVGSPTNYNGLYAILGVMVVIIIIKKHKSNRK